MAFLLWLLTAAYFINCFLLIVIVLMQEPKGGGLSSAFGGAGLDTAFGASIGRKMSSFTVYVAVLFIILTITLAILTKSVAAAPEGSIFEESGTSQEEKSLPAEDTDKTPEKGKAEENKGDQSKADESKSAEGKQEEPVDTKEKPDNSKESGSTEESPEKQNKQDTTDQ